MFHYSILQFATFVALMFCYNVICVFLAMIEFYLMCCSLLLIGERKTLSQQSALNVPETPPPQYESCVNDAPVQAFAMQLVERRSSSQNAKTESGSSSQNAETESDEGQETEENAVTETNSLEKNMNINIELESESNEMTQE